MLSFHFFTLEDITTSPHKQLIQPCCHHQKLMLFQMTSLFSKNMFPWFLFSCISSFHLLLEVQIWVRESSRCFLVLRTTCRKGLQDFVWFVWIFLCIFRWVAEHFVKTWCERNFSLLPPELHRACFTAVTENMVSFFLPGSSGILYHVIVQISSTYCPVFFHRKETQTWSNQNWPLLNSQLLKKANLRIWCGCRQMGSDPAPR